MTTFTPTPSQQADDRYNRYCALCGLDMGENPDYAICRACEHKAAGIDDDDEPFGTVECRFCGGHASWRTVWFTDPLWDRFSQEEQLRCWDCNALIEIGEQEPW